MNEEADQTDEVIFFITWSLLIFIIGVITGGSLKLNL